MDRKGHAPAETLVGASGAIVFPLGAVKLVLPGRAFIAIPLGLGILGTEFQWAGPIRENALARLHGWKKGDDSITTEVVFRRLSRVLGGSARKGR